MPVLPPSGPSEWSSGAGIALILWPRKARWKLGEERNGPSGFALVWNWGQLHAASNFIMDFCETGQSWARHSRQPVKSAASVFGCDSDCRKTETVFPQNTVFQPHWLEAALKPMLPGRVSKCLQSHTFCVTSAKGNLALPVLSGTAAFVPSSAGKDSKGLQFSLEKAIMTPYLWGFPAFISKLLPVLPPPIPESLPDVWQTTCLSVRASELITRVSTWVGCSPWCSDACLCSRWQGLHKERRTAGGVLMKRLTCPQSCWRPEKTLTASMLLIS